MLSSPGMLAVTPTRTGLRWGTVRLAACLLLAVIAADLASDARCDDGATSARGAAAVSDQGQRQGRTHEPCTDFCVPDCFCCSRSVAAGPALLLPEPERLLLFDAPAPERWLEGVRPVVDRPPLSRG